MTDSDIVAQLPLFSADMLGPKTPRIQADLHTRWLHSNDLPPFVTDCAPAMRILDLLGPLHWDELPERNLQRNWGQVTLSNACLIGAELIKLNEGLPSFGHLYRYLIEHSAFIWLLGFPLVPAPKIACGFNALASLPTERHLTRMLRQMPHPALQFLLADSVRLIDDELRARGIMWGECISLDTKHILAWVKENNPKAYVADRYNKANQPPGDPDCRLGCKRRHNRSGDPTTPTSNPVPAHTLKAGEYHWGYASGIVVTLVPDYGEFVLADLTQTFDHADVSYFFPLIHDTELRLGHKPRFGTFDAAFDAWYVYAYFSSENDNPDGMAAVPFSHKGGHAITDRRFSPDGLPLCPAGLPMPLQFTFVDHTSCLVQHQRGKYVCPLPSESAHHPMCPIHHPRSLKGGCTAMMPTSLGARLRYQIDRDSDLYKNLYRQRTAVERINSQAVALGIERPHLRNGAAIANQNTLIYLLINLRFLQRLRRGQRKDE
jgi:hypothetical protein